MLRIATVLAALMLASGTAAAQDRPETTGTGGLPEIGPGEQGFATGGRPAAPATTPSGGEEGREEAVVDRMVDNAERDPDTGLVEAGKVAEPVENWFGCKPSAEGQMEACDEGDSAAVAE